MLSYVCICIQMHMLKYWNSVFVLRLRSIYYSIAVLQFQTLIWAQVLLLLLEAVAPPFTPKCTPILF